MNKTHRLLYQYLGDKECSFQDSDNLEHLREVRLTMIATGREFYIEPYIEYIGEESWYVDGEGFFHYVNVK